MTRDDIISLAKEAGFQTDMFGLGIWDSSEFNKFAELVAAAEREACAKVADAYEPRCDSCPSGVVNAIRARGQV